jgi:hypothetical protein
MATNRKVDRERLLQETRIMVTALRVHWLQQLLDWPLRNGSIAGRLTKAEAATLRKAAKQSKLF